MLGDPVRLEVVIEESYEFKVGWVSADVIGEGGARLTSGVLGSQSTVDRLLKKTNLALVIGTNSWREQFVEAITVSGGKTRTQSLCGVGRPEPHLSRPAGGDDDDDGKLPSCLDYVMHFLTVFWKLLFACVPPTDYWNGWACFLVSISGIGLLTAVIGDLASHFGCTVGLKDSVTAVVFVALGTSVPG